MGGGGGGGIKVYILKIRKWESERELKEVVEVDRIVIRAICLQNYTFTNYPFFIIMQLHCMCRLYDFDILIHVGLYYIFTIYR